MICLSRKAFPAVPSSPTPSLPSLIHTSVRPPQRSINSLVDLIVQNYIIINQIDVPNPKNPNSPSYHLIYNIQIHANTCTSSTGHKHRRHEPTGRPNQLGSPTATTDSTEYSKFSTPEVTSTQMKGENGLAINDIWSIPPLLNKKKTSNLKFTWILAPVEEMRCCLAKRRCEMESNPKTEHGRRQGRNWRTDEASTLQGKRCAPVMRTSAFLVTKVNLKIHVASY
jgi:hypothetical protein